MVWITKCVNPPATATRIVVAVPPKAEYETGFSRWIDRLAHMALQIGCRIISMPTKQPFHIYARASLANDMTYGTNITQ